jgi:putative nucleotidyltransferase with HDIG domain
MGNINLTETIAKRVNNVPMLSTVVTRLLMIIEDEEHSVRDVVNIVQNDASLTAKVLRISNSAVFSRGQPIETLNRAILHLGEKMVMGIAIGACSAKIINKPLKGYISSSDEFWDHSLRTAVASRLASEYSREPVSSDIAFTAGLLHDIGKSVLSEFLEERSGNIIELYSSQEDDYIAAEKYLLGIDHAAVGFAIAKHWKLPIEIANIIKHHHSPAKAKPEYRYLAYVVHLGDIIAMLGGAGTGADNLAYKIDEKYINFINLNKYDFARLILSVQEEFGVIKDSVFGAEN